MALGCVGRQLHFWYNSLRLRLRLRLSCVRHQDLSMLPSRKFEVEKSLEPEMGAKPISDSNLHESFSFSRQLHQKTAAKPGSWFKSSDSSIFVVNPLSTVSDFHLFRSHRETAPDATFPSFHEPVANSIAGQFIFQKLSPIEGSSF